MRFMRWGWQDYLCLPEFHRRVLIDMVQDEARRAEHERAVASVRRRR